MKNNIRQCGIIESIHGNRAHIRTTRSSACGSCEASAGCHAIRGKTFHVDIVDDRLANHKPGDHVYIEIPAKTGRLALLVGFGLPLVIFVATLLCLHTLGTKDDQAALGAIGTLVAYYLIIYILRRTVNRHFAIHLAGEQ